MSDFDSIKITIDMIKNRISQEAAERKAEGPRFSRHDRSAVKSVKIKSAKPEIAPKWGKHIRLDDLMKYHDKEFVRNSYLGILKREPDATGFQCFVEALRDGRLTKIEIVLSIRYSKEGREKNVQIENLIFLRAISYIFRIPVLGPLASVFWSLIQLPKISKHIEKVEALSIAKFAQHDDTFYRFEEKTNMMSADMKRINAEADKTRGELKSEVMALKESKADHLAVKELKSEVTSLKESKASVQSIVELSEASQSHNAEILNLQNLLHRHFEEIRMKLSGTLTESGIQRLLAEEDHLFDALYVAFENQFRGTRNDIKERAKVYLPYIERAAAGIDEALILDVGCGRGEWLELLKENTYVAKGIDRNRIMATQCRERGLDVVDGDVLEYLRDQKSNTFIAVTGIHIIEHLHFPVLMDLLDEVRRTLKRGGVVILETPNPENVLVGATNFYIDMTHDKPVHPLTMQFLLSRKGFVNTEIIRMNAMPAQAVDNQVLHALLFGPQDYAALGFKP